MRIVLIGPAHPLRGGIAQYNTSLAKSFISSGDEVLVISFVRQYPGIFFPGKTQQDHSDEAFRVEAEHLIDSISPFNWARVGRRIAEFKPELVLFQWWQPFFALSFQGIIRRMRRLHQAPVVYLCHNLVSHEHRSFPGRHFLERILAKIAFRGVDGFLAHADELREGILRLAPGKPVVKICHPLYDFYSSWDQEGEIEESTVLRVLFFGKIRRYKGLEVLIEALGQLGERVPFQAVFAGECYLSKPDFEKRIVELGLEKKIVWIDRYIPNQEIPGLFRSADVVVLPYLSASQSGVIPVAYQFETPVIVSDVGGLWEVVREGKTGYLVKPGDPGALADAIIRFYNLPSRSFMKKEIRGFRERFTWTAATEAVRGLRQEIIRKGIRSGDE